LFAHLIVFNKQLKSNHSQTGRLFDLFIPEGWKAELVVQGIDLCQKSLCSFSSPNCITCFTKKINKSNSNW